MLLATRTVEGPATWKTAGHGSWQSAVLPATHSLGSNASVHALVDDITVLEIAWVQHLQLQPFPAIGRMKLRGATAHEQCAP